MPERGDLTRAVMVVLRNSRGCPLSSYEVFERLPTIGITVDSRQVKECLNRQARRKKVMRIKVDEMRGKYPVKNKYFLKTLGGSNIAQSR